MSTIVFYFLAALVSSTYAECSHFMSCPCGSSNKNYTFCIDGFAFEENICERWLECETCQEDIPDCVTCPSGRSGRLCTRGTDPEIDCVPLDHVENSQVLVDKNRTTMDSKVLKKYPAGTKLEFSCNFGYALRGARLLECLEHGIWSDMPPRCTRECGKVLTPLYKVVNGSQVADSEWPWMVSISLPQNSSTSMICSGVLIDRRTVLSAAHCLYNRTSDYVLQFGNRYERNVSDMGEEIRKSAEVIIHPDFNPITYENDIALIKLESSVSYTDKILPICLPTAETSVHNLVPDNTGLLTGYGIGAKRMLDVYPGLLMVSRLPVMSNKTCTEFYEDKGISIDVGPSKFCAMNIHESCVVDSGAPFVFYNTTSEKYTLEGVVSESERGQCAKTPTVFTKISYYLPWIKDNRWRRTHPTVSSKWAYLFP